MKYAILRTQKLKSTTAVRRSMKHAFREQDTPNADESRSPDNTHIGAQDVLEGMEKLEARLPEKVRKNGVLCIEYLMTASPEAMAGKSKAEQDAFFGDSLEWLRDKHGAENVLYAGIHRDEKTPHMYAYVVPIDPKGKLNCRHFLGGAKALSEMQTDFAERVGKTHGLERGLEGSKSKHQRVKRFYAELEREPTAPIRISEQDLKPQKFKEGLLGKIGLATHVETPQGVADRINAGVEKALAPALAEAARSRIEAARVQEREKTMQAMSAENKGFRKVLETFFTGLTKDSREKLASYSQELRKQQERKERARELRHEREIIPGRSR